MISGGQQASAAGAVRFAHAWQAMRHDPSIQFNLAPVPLPPEAPAWLKAFFHWLGKILEPVGRFLAWLGSFFPDALYVRYLLWILLALGIAAILWALYNRLYYGEWSFRLPRRAGVTPIAEDDEWAPEESGARAWLEEADKLALEGHFAEAIHHLLFRSIEDIARRRPALVRPALTSRELAGSQGIPFRARDLFAGIAGMVERSLFGGRSVGEADWVQAREAYSGFALSSAWRA